MPRDAVFEMQKWVVLPPLAVGFFLPRQENGNPRYEYPLVGLHRGIKVRYELIICRLVHSLRPD